MSAIPPQNSPQSPSDGRPLCWEDGPHFLRLPINSNLPRPSTAGTVTPSPTAPGQHSPAHGPGLDGVQLLPATGTAEPPPPIDLFYHEFAPFFWRTFGARTTNFGAQN